MLYPSLKPLLIATLAAAPLAASAQDDAPFFYLLEGPALSCLKAHAADYAPEPGRTAFIETAACGSAEGGVGGSMDLLAQVQNSAPDLDTKEEDGPDAVVALSAEDFDCLAALDIPEGAALLAWYPESCDVEIRD